MNRAKSTKNPDKINIKMIQYRLTLHYIGPFEDFAIQFRCMRNTLECRKLLHKPLYFQKIGK